MLTPNLRSLTPKGSRWLLLTAVLAAWVLPARAADAQDAALTAVVEIPEQLVMTNEGSGFDVLDNVVRSTGGPIVFTSVGEPVTLPVSVAEGRGLLEYTDASSGITVTPNTEGHLVRVPIKDAQGNDTIRVLITVAGLIGTGDAVAGTVTDIGIDAPTRSADLSGQDARVGTASVKVLGSLSSFPGQSGMTMTIAKAPEQAALDAFAEAAFAQGLAIEDVAFVTGFEKTGLDQSIASITLRMSVGHAWTEATGLSNVRVYRRADDGAVEELVAPVEDPAAEQVQFNVESPNGLSTFIIAAVRAAPPTPTPTLVLSQPTATATPAERPTLAPAATATLTPTAPPDLGGSGCNRSGGAAGLDGVLLAGMAIGGFVLARRRV